jgi:uncharacterized protein YrrD
MRTSRELAGMAIVDVRDGKRLGKVDEVVVSPDDGRLLGFVIKAGGLFGGAETIVEIEDVRSIGHDAITVEGEEVAHTSEASTDAFRAARDGDRMLVGRKIVTQDGTLVGQVADVVINEDQRRVTALLVGGGLLERGDAFPAERIVSVGPDVVVVRGDDTTEGAPGPFGPSGESRTDRDIRPYPVSTSGGDDARTIEEPSGRDPV